MTAAVLTQVGSQPGFTDVLASEWTKLRSVRSFYIEILLAIGLSLGLTALICLAIGSTFDELSPSDQASFDPVFISFVGSAFGGIVLIVLGVTFLSSEYTSGMSRITFTTTPRRGRVLAAKVLLVTLVSLALGLIMSFGGFFVGQAVLGAFDVATASLDESDTLRAVMGGWLTSPFFPLVGAALAAIFRNTATAITSVLSLIFIPGIFGALLPRWVQENGLRYLPGNAQDHVLMTNFDPDSAFYLAVGAAVAVMAVWLLLFWAVAYVLTIKRDIG